jgi:hypothetical protein
MAERRGSWTSRFLCCEATRYRWRGTCGGLAPGEVAQQNAIHIPRPLFPLFHCHQPRTAGFQLSYRPAFRVLVRFFLLTRQQRKRMPVSALHAIWVCCSLSTVQISYRHPAFRVLVVFFLLTPTRKRIPVLRSMPFGFAATQRTECQISYRHPLSGPFFFSVDQQRKRMSFSALPFGLLLLSETNCQISYRHLALHGDCTPRDPDWSCETRLETKST